jgi:hypothetical protein
MSDLWRAKGSGKFETGGGVLRKKGGKNEFSKRNFTWNWWRCLGKKVG